MARQGIRLVVDLVGKPGGKLDGIHADVKDILEEYLKPHVTVTVDVGCTWEEPDV